MEHTEDDTFDALRKPPTEDELEFGRKKWIYCGQHLNPHITGWCTVGNQHKTLLDATTQEEAYEECRRKDFALYRDSR